MLLELIRILLYAVGAIVIGIGCALIIAGLLFILSALGG